LGQDRVEVIFVGVEIPAAISQAARDAARKRFAIPRESMCLSNVAAFVPEKGHMLLVRAFAELRAQFPQCVLLLAGEGREKANLQALVRELHVEDVVKFPGFVADVESVYAATDLFIFPSHQEPLACAMLSAMAYGIPVVAFNRGGNPEAIEDGKNGLLVKELDPALLASAIARLVAHPDEAALLGQAARETVKKRFSDYRMTEETLRLYEQLVAAGSNLNSRSRA
jgi:glycosyltransferase involved in cell wall biosynthesis